MISMEPMSISISDPIDVGRTFLQLTQYTCPNGYEAVMYGDALEGMGFTLHSWGFQARMGTPEQQRIMFAAHLDDVSRQVSKVTHRFSDTTVSSDGKTILGADDKAGVAILLYLLARGVPGTYSLFFGEECGCIGSSELAHATSAGEYDAVISFDRAGYSDVITHQGGMRTCSDAFASALSAALNVQEGFNYAPCDGGVYTDSREFSGVVPECTNISVGYHRQHSQQETQDLEWLCKLAHACTQVDWHSLPIERNPSVEEYTWSRSLWDDNVDDDWSSSSSTLSYYETRYGLTPAMEDMVEMIDNVSQHELVDWAYSNVEKLAAFFQEVALNNPRLAEEIANRIDREKL